MFTLVNVVSALIAILTALGSEPIIPANLVPYLLLVVSVLAIVRDFLKARVPPRLAFLLK